MKAGNEKIFRKFISITSFLLCYCLFLFSCGYMSAPAVMELPNGNGEDIEYSCRKYLIHDFESGYGLYSYILFNGKPGPFGSSKFDRYLSLYEAYINTFPQCFTEEYPYLPKESINLMVWPLQPYPTSVANRLQFYEKHYHQTSRCRK